ncbi:MAG TPA: bifunctional hydroxymethylpyrimidine kinase/phosphomethylpyrimidine kinase [Acidobacteriota bacterium]|nr:bifunctional hydroxymethylpyrimidine kinase/phosphomethylpyrimidine kinase [Acidobacteriota bacterium]
MKNRTLKPNTVLTIAGSDSGGCAGIQADLRVFHNLEVHGMSAVTCITAQNTMGISQVLCLPSGIIAAQINSVLADIGCGSAKSGMLGNRSIVRTVARAAARWKIRNLVVDPVMVSSTGTALLKRDAIYALRDDLIPLACLVTPNLAEAERLTEKPVRTIQAMERAAETIFRSTGCPALVKGGHRTGPALDVFFDGSRLLRISRVRIRTRHNHGSGCTLSAAIAAFLARGEPMEKAIVKAKDYVTEALRTGYSVGKGRGPLGNVE